MFQLFCVRLMLQKTRISELVERKAGITARSIAIEVDKVLDGGDEGKKQKKARERGRDSSR